MASTEECYKDQIIHGTSCYCRFIEGFSKIACPITSLQKKGVKFKQTYECEESFKQLKDLLTNAPILRLLIQLRIS